MVRKHSKNSRNYRDNQDNLGESQNHIDQALKKQLEKKKWYSNKKKYSQGKLKLYTNYKELPDFENCLNESNPKLCQAIKKIRIRAHKLSVKIRQKPNRQNMSIVL